MFRKSLIKSVLTSLLLVLPASNVAASQSELKSFAELDHQAAVKQAHQWYKNDQGIVVKVMPNEVVATQTSSKQSASVAIPKDQFYLSIAPWINYTHPCTYHVPTGCTGELIQQKMHMSAVDMESGEEILNQMITTQHDGFIDFWVPRNRRLEFTFHHGDANGVYREAKEVLSTFGDARTCITTMQLKSMKTGHSKTSKHSGHKGHH
ncbi:CueP family metal-binding protein [Paraferrimonas sedimenticola]|uniref:Uncharacterized protein n=1 Tax=Paraferrimonas sedimenticola TaxID=375674 RepID=A0AA37W1N9_9GAMM|nr:CueP family metal-binding protein [Paraferrimonas sedimenticola]GLP96522.1 hypothetical protein GCM10007895_18280 [Paraferrimonas sedimenticola]